MTPLPEVETSPTTGDDMMDAEENLTTVETSQGRELEN
jgi:hypothetical protein